MVGYSSGVTTHVDDEAAKMPARATITFWKHGTRGRGKIRKPKLSNRAWITIGRKRQGGKRKKKEYNEAERARNKETHNEGKGNGV